jgi:hypothetical protein
MTVQVALANLVDKLREHMQELGVLATLVTEDSPSERPAFVDRLGESVEAARGHAEEGLAAARGALGAVEYPPDLGRTRRELAVAHRSLAQLGRALVSDLASSRHRRELRRLSVERGDGWSAWAGVVDETIERCIEQLHEVNDGIAATAAELADPEFVSVAVSVHSASPPAGRVAPDREWIETSERMEDVR